MSEEEQIILPDGFKRVEFLQSNGNEYLYLPDLTISSNDTIVWKQKLIGNILPTDGVFSSYNYSEKPFRFAANYNSGYLMINLFSSTNTPSLSYYKSGSNFILSKNKLIIDNKTISENFNFKDDEVTGICIFTERINGTYYNSLIQLYYWEVKGKCKLIPCLDTDGHPCMYDLVSQKPFYNQGTGKFLTNKDYEWNYPLINNNYNLPAGFKKCVYLQSDGTQWIDTGVKPNNETGLFCKTIKLDNSNTSMFGVRENDSSAIMTPFISGKTTLYYKWKTEGKDTIYTVDKAGDYIFSSFLNFYNDRLAKIDSEDTDWITSLSGILENYTQSIWLFSTNFKGSFASNGKYAGRIYRAQITQGDALIHDYVPCLDANGRPCMYDLIESEALYNQSGGTEFAYCVEHQLPSDFVKLKYLESNSDLQHIKTSYVPTNNTGMYVDAYNTVVEDRVVMGMQNTTSGNDRVWIGGVMKSTYGARYGWGTMTNLGGTGDVRFEASLNWLNDKKSIITCPAFAQKVNTLSDLTFTPNQDIYIFGWNRQGSLFHWKGRIYRAKISEGSEIVRDFVPAYDDLKQKPCMYDLINNVAYYNDGEGEFLHNRDFEGTYKGFSGLGCIGNRLGASEFEWKIPHGYVRVAFLESTGTQWMNTNYVPTTYSGVYVKYQGTENSKLKNACWPIMSYDDGDHAIAPVTNRYGTSGAWYWETKLDPGYLHDQKSTDYIWESTINFYDDGNTSMKVIKNGNFERTYELGKWGTSSRRFEYTPTDPFRICYVKWLNKGVTPWKIYNVKITEGMELKRDYVPVIDSSGTPCMYDLVTKMPLHNSGSGTFVAGLETLSHALQLRFPNDGGTITLSLPTNDNIEHYEAKIRNNNPNWTINFQYH